MSQSITSGPQHSDDEHEGMQLAQELDDGDDTQGHLMIRTDDTVTQDKKVHGSPRRS